MSDRLIPLAKKDAIAEDYAAGHPLKEIAQRHGVAIATCSQIAFARGLPKRKRVYTKRKYDWGNEAWWEK